MAKASKAAKAAGTVKIKMIGSVIGCTDDQRATVRGLGLRQHAPGGGARRTRRWSGA